MRLYVSWLHLKNSGKCWLFALMWRSAHTQNTLRQRRFFWILNDVCLCSVVSASERASILHTILRYSAYSLQSPSASLHFVDIPFSFQLLLLAYAFIHFFHFLPQNEFYFRMITGQSALVGCVATFRSRGCEGHKYVFQGRPFAACL